MWAWTHAAAAIERGWIKDDDMALPLRGAASVDDVEGTSRECLSQLARVADGGRADHQAGRRAVVRADAQESAQHVGDVAAEDAPVGVGLVDDHVAQLLEELEPLGVVGQDGAAQHVRIAQHHLASLAHDGPDGCRRISVVDGGREVHAGQARQIAELGQLILAECLGGEEVERPGSRILGDGLQDRQVVAERLARGSGCHDGDVASLAKHRQRLRLVAVERLDAALPQGAHEPIVQPGRQVRVDGWPCRNDPPGGQRVGEPRLAQ